jgi:nucleoside diphosphate kinase
VSRAKERPLPPTPLPLSLPPPTPTPSFRRSSFCLVTEAATSAIGRVWQASEASGLRGVAARMVTLNEDDARTVSQAVGAAVPAGPALALSLMGEKSDEKVRALASHIHEKAGVPANSVLCAESARANDALTAAFFGDRKGRLPSANVLSGGFTDCAAVLVLPGALSTGNAGNILAEMQERATASGLSLSALRMTSFTRGEAEEFLEVYKGVVPEYVVRKRGRGEGGRGDEGGNVCLPGAVFPA